MSPPPFPPEIYQNIFKLFDYKTLNKSIYVSRLWCTYAIPLLWQDPLQIIFNQEKNILLNAKLIINTYVSFLPSNSKAKAKLIENDITPTSRVAIFNYPEYLNNLNYFLFHDSVASLFSQKPSMIKQKLIKLILEELFELFFNQSKNLVGLEYGTPVILDYHNLDQSLNPIFIKLENFSRLSKLKRFSCRADTTSELIYTISKVSRELLQIDIQQGSDDEALCALVNSQNNLQEFEMSTCLEAKKVLTAILKKSRTLRKISIVGGSMISFDFFFQCPNLEELTLKFPMKIPGSERKWIQYSDFENDFTNWNNNNNDNDNNDNNNDNNNNNNNNFGRLLPSLLEYHIHLLAVLYGQALQYRNVYSSQVESRLSSEIEYNPSLLLNQEEEEEEGEEEGSERNRNVVRSGGRERNERGGRKINGRERFERYEREINERERNENHPIKLFKLEIHRSYQNIIKIINLIKTSNSKLLILNLDLPNPKDPENYSHLLSTIINYCPNLVNLNLYIPTQSLSFISNLFSQCSNLEVIILRGDNNYHHHHHHHHQSTTTTTTATTTTTTISSSSTPSSSSSSSSSSSTTTSSSLFLTSSDRQDISNILNKLGSVIPRNIQFLALGIQTWKFQPAALDNFLQHCENRINNLPFNFAIDTNCEAIDIFRKYRKRGVCNLLVPNF
ncbi:hypothetical protein Glove_106g9 [Diversispora epigaea]|uniref:F-box domain-containing protein n=1 Tax=Diversispora epigaea TaxID=1348612 RepID=A0A397J5I1_9GLOM|nr:hypothetical protein Glove_106g9 [Diversispora epigaea]